MRPALFLVILAGPAEQGGAVGKGHRPAQGTKLQVAGQPQVFAALLAGMGQGMLEQGQQRDAVDLRPPHLGHVAQEPTGRGQRQRPSGAVVGDDAPAVERGGDLPGQGPVGGNQRRRLAALGGVPQDQRDGIGLIARRWRLDQRDALGRLAHVGETRTFALPDIGDRRGPEREGQERVAAAAGGFGGLPGRDIGP